MPITTLDGAIAGAKPPEAFIKAGATMEAAGVFHSYLYTAGRPGAAVAPAPGLNGAALTTYAGQIPVPAASANTHLYRFSASSTGSGVLRLYDRLWHNSGLVVTTTTAQAMTPVAIPARDKTGTTAGDGVQAAIEVSTATTNAAAVTNMTISYTNQAGTAGKVGTISATQPGGGFPATAVAGTLCFFELAAGDTGVRSVESVTLGTSLVTGAVHIVLVRLIAEAQITSSNVGTDKDFITSGGPRVYDNSVPFLVFCPTSTTAAFTHGSVTFTQG